MPNNHAFIQKVNYLLNKLDQDATVTVGVELANEIIKLLGISDIKSAENVFESSLELPNVDRYDSWFQPHPIFKSDRSCFELLDSKFVQAKFYWLKKKSRQFIAGGVHFTPNFEDEEYTQNERYKVGIDFFLSPNGKSLQIVLSNRGNLRIVELYKKLNNTQIDIFTIWEDVAKLSNQKAIHTTLWESFKLKAVNEKFYTEIANNFTVLTQHLSSIGKEAEASKLFANRLLGRLLFCWFLRKKGIIDESNDYFITGNMDSTKYYRDKLERLFFKTLNTPIEEREDFMRKTQKELFPDLVKEQQPSIFTVDVITPYLNGGLFEPHENDWYKDDSLTFPDGFFTGLFNHFEEFNFTTDESTPEYEQIAIDPEMLGRVFESFLATQIDETGKQARKAKGAFYTPREIVSYMCKESLRNYLYNALNNDENIKSAVDGLLDISDSEWAKSVTNSRRDTVKNYKTQIMNALDAVKILDPACGSGAFPMGILQLLTKIYERLEGRFDVYKTKLQIVQNNIFGVDIEPMAVEIARLRAWLSLIVDEEDSRNVAPLPNLEFKFVCANSLLPLESGDQQNMFSDNNLHNKLKTIRDNYFNARSFNKKKQLQKEYYALINSGQQTLDGDDKRTLQLKSFDPFKNSKSAVFFDLDQMFGMNEGFDIVLGNPPYGSSIKDDYRREIVNSLGKVPDYEIYYYFMEQGRNLLHKGGFLSYIIPNTFLFNVFADTYRKKLLKEWSILTIIDCTNFKLFANATVFNAIVLFKKAIESEPIGYKNTLFAKSFLELINRPTLYIKPDELLTCNQNWGLVFRLSKEKLGVVAKIKDQAIELQAQFPDISQGLIAYDKYQGQSDEIIKKRAYHYLSKAHDNLKHWLYGEDVKQYLVKWNEKEWIDYGNGIANPRQPKFFNGARILIREITNPNIYAAFTDQEFYYDPSVIIVLDNSKSNISILYLLGILNSHLATFYHFNNSPKATKGGFPKILVKDIQDFPIKIISAAEQRPFIEIVDKILFMTKDDDYLQNNRKQVQVNDYKEQIDNMIYKLYGLSDEEKKIIENSTN